MSVILTSLSKKVEFGYQTWLVRLPSLDLGFASRVGRSVNQRNEGIRFNYWTLNTRGITKWLYLDLSLRYLFILCIFYLCDKANGLEAAFLRDNIFWYLYYFHRFSCNQVAVNLDAAVVLVLNGNIVEKSHCSIVNNKCWTTSSKGIGPQLHSTTIFQPF